MEFGVRVVYHMGAFLINELGKCLIFKPLLLAMSLASISNLVICSKVDLLVPAVNLVNLGTLHPLGISA